MATIQTTKLILKIAAGVTSTGAQSFVQRTFSNITPGISDEELYAIGAKLGALQSGTVSEVRRQDLKALNAAA